MDGGPTRVDGLACDELAEVHFDGCPARFRQIVGGAQPGRDVFPARQARNRAKLRAGNEWTFGPVGLRCVGIQIIETEAASSMDFNFFNGCRVDRSSTRRRILKMRPGKPTSVCSRRIQWTIRGSR